MDGAGDRRASDARHPQRSGVFMDHPGFGRFRFCCTFPVSDLPDAFADAGNCSRHAKAAVAVAQRAAKRALNPSTIVGWERTASRSLVAGIPAIMNACTVPIISPASAARMVHPRIR